MEQSGEEYHQSVPLSPWATSDIAILKYLLLKTEIIGVKRKTAWHSVFGYLFLEQILIYFCIYLSRRWGNQRRMVQWRGAALGLPGCLHEARWGGVSAVSHRCHLWRQQAWVISQFSTRKRGDKRPWGVLPEWDLTGRGRSCLEEAPEGPRLLSHRDARTSRPSVVGQESSDTQRCTPVKWESVCHFKKILLNFCFFPNLKGIRTKDKRQRKRTEQAMLTLLQPGVKPQVQRAEERNEDGSFNQGCTEIYLIHKSGPEVLWFSFQDVSRGQGSMFLQGPIDTYASLLYSDTLSSPPCST